MQSRGETARRACALYEGLMTTTKQKIKVGDTFTLTSGRRVDAYARTPDDPKPPFECERMRVTHLSCSVDPKMKPYTFAAEPAWFTVRKLEAE